MKISEARQLYSSQIKAYREQQLILSKQKQELEQKINTTPDGKNVYANEAATLELTMKAVDDKQNEYRDYMEKLIEQWSATANMISSKQQGEAMEESMADMGKILEVARRIMKGGIVPPSDEKKLMDFSMELYQAAKNIGALAKKREEYDSLWEEKKEEELEDPADTADNTEAFSKGPEIVDIQDTVTSVTPDASASISSDAVNSIE